MTLDDPSRQRLGGFPMYYWGAQPVGPLGGFQVQPLDRDSARVIFNLMIRPGVASQFYDDILASELTIRYDIWYNDPEAVFQALGWVYDASQVKSLSLSLKDLGL